MPDQADEVITYHVAYFNNLGDGDSSPDYQTYDLALSAVQEAFDSPKMLWATKAVIIANGDVDHIEVILRPGAALQPAGDA